MSPNPDMSSVIIQIDRPGRKLAMEAVRKLLEGTGIEIDADYGPIPINPAIGRYVVRGRATLEARAKAEKYAMASPGTRYMIAAETQSIVGQVQVNWSDK